MVETLTRLHFEPHVGDSFLLSVQGRPVALTLHETRPLGEAMRSGGAFALYFAGPPAPILPQATYALRHATLGAIDLFIVPIGQAGEGVRYEAIFT